MVAIAKQRGESTSRSSSGRSPITAVLVALAVGYTIAYLQYSARRDYIPSVIREAILLNDTRPTSSSNAIGDGSVSDEVGKDTERGSKKHEANLGDPDPVSKLASTSSTVTIQLKQIPDNYSNVPPFQLSNEEQKQMEQLLNEPVGEPNGLLHKANPPGSNVVMGLAAYPKNMGCWKRLVGSLRNSGYDGHIIFGVHKEIPQDEQDYLKEMDVTSYIVDFVDCDSSVLGGEAKGGSAAVRGKCAKGIEKLNLEWGRYEMARQWLNACDTCTGWSLVMDTRDLFFQADPFASLPPPKEAKQDLLFIEEIAKHTSPLDDPKRWFKLGNARFMSRVGPCYGRSTFKAYAERPVLCSGTVIGTRRGMHRFLSVLVGEFYSNNQKKNKNCKSPGMTDQWNMNYLYYNGKFGEYGRTKTIPWGTGPVMTIGHPCINKNIPNPNHSQKDMIVFDKETGLIRNNWETDDNSKARIAPVVHQFDRCHKWIHPWFSRHGDLFNTVPTLAWK